MGATMKGLLRGLRFISTIFDEKEPEMQIGFPTDVKHVAHIGWDGGASANKPSWMSEFKCPPEYSNGPINSAGEASEFEEKPKHKSRRSSSAAASPINSPSRKNTDGSRRSLDSAHNGSKYPRCGNPSLFSSLSPKALIKQSRRDRSANAFMDSPTREGTGSPANSRTTRRQQNSGLGIGTSARDGLVIAKHSRTKKPKGSSRTSKTKDKKSSGEGLASKNSETKTTAGHLTSVLEAYEEEG